MTEISEYDFRAPTMSEQHSQWHLANPERPYDCPLDCGAGEADDFDLDQVDVGEIGPRTLPDSPVVQPTVAPEGNTATPPQLRYIDGLKAKKDLSGVEQQLEDARQAWREHRFTKREAGRLIDLLRDQPWKPDPKHTPVSDLSAGLYTNGGKIIRVYLGQKSGQLLAKAVTLVDTRPELNDGYGKRIEYDYLGLATRFVTTGFHRMSAEEAGVLGKASGHCGDCGRRLDDPESVDRGIGPICFGKYDH